MRLGGSPLFLLLISSNIQHKKHTFDRKKTSIDVLIQIVIFSPNLLPDKEVK